MTTDVPIRRPVAGTIDNSESGAREARLGSVTGYCGTLRDLADRSGCDGPQDRDRCYSQASLCNSACALSLTSYIVDAAIVHHGPAGCAVTAMSTANSKDQLADAVGLDNSRSGYVCTDMGESDTVFGAVDTLRDVALETYRRYRPEALFIGASCVSGVIGEDLDGVAREVAEATGVPVAPIHCEGFKSKIWASGFDAAFHAIINHIVRPPQRRRPVVNVINFFGSARAELTALFAELGVEPLFVISNTSVDQLSRLGESVATVSTCGTLGSYLGAGLEERYGVPYVRSLQPYGVQGFTDWLLGLGRVLGKQAEAQAILDRERERYLSRIEEVAARLRGLRAVVGMGPGYGFNTVRVLGELGIEVVHQAAWHYDRQYDDGRAPAAFDVLAGGARDYAFSVSDLQNQEIVNILRDTRPDIYFSRHPGSTVWATKLGIPALCIVDEYHVLGYRGLLDFAHSVLDVVTNRSFTENLARRVKLPYTDWWLDQRHDHFLTSEPGVPAGATTSDGELPGD